MIDGLVIGLVFLVGFSAGCATAGLVGCALESRRVQTLELPPLPKRRG
jgi:hypothetical protein